MIYFEWPPQHILAFMLRLLSWMDVPEEGGVKDSKWSGHGGCTGSFTEWGCWVKGDLALGKDWVKKPSASWVYVSQQSLPPLNRPPFNLVPFHPGSSFSIKEVLEGGRLSHIFVKQRGAHNWWQLSDTWISPLNPRQQLIQIAFYCIPAHSAHFLFRL